MSVSIGIVASSSRAASRPPSARGNTRAPPSRACPKSTHGFAQDGPQLGVRPSLDCAVGRRLRPRLVQDGVKFTDIHL